MTSTQSDKTFTCACVLYPALVIIVLHVVSSYVAQRYAMYVLAFSYYKIMFGSITSGVSIAYINWYHIGYLFARHFIRFFVQKCQNVGSVSLNVFYWRPISMTILLKCVYKAKLWLPLKSTLTEVTLNMPPPNFEQRPVENTDTNIYHRDIQWLKYMNY